MSKVYYEAKDASGNYGLWVSDGTAIGTSEVVVGTQGAFSLSPFYVTQVGAGAGIVFSGDGFHGR